MNLERLLFIGDNIEIFIGKKIFVFKVRDIWENKLIVSCVANCSAEEIGAGENKIVNVNTYRPNGIYKYDMTILSVTQENKTCILELELCSDIKKMQKREFFRLDVRISACIRIILHNEEKNKTSKYDVVTLDISGGGMKAVSKKPIPSQAVAMITVYFNKYDEKFDEINIIGRILRCEKRMNENNDYAVYIQFEKSEKEASEKIVKYIFEIQRENLRKIKGK